MRNRNRKPTDKQVAVEAGLRELAENLVGLCRDNGGAAAMVRIYTTANHNNGTEQDFEVSANFYERSHNVTGGNAFGHPAEPLVAFKEAVE